MLIYIGADHRGFSLKESIKSYLQESGYEVVDMGAASYDEGDDYPDFAAKVAEKISLSPAEARGILLCGSGVGVDVVANKYRGVRSALAISADQIFAARHDDDVNVLALAADHLSEDDVKKMVSVFIQTNFSGDERYKRRIRKIEALEK